MQRPILAVLLAIAACAPVKPRDYRDGFTAAPPAAAGHGLVYLYKIWQPNSEFDDIDIYVDEANVATLQQYQYTWLHLPVGIHRFTAHVRQLGPVGYWIPPREIEIEEGQTVLLAPLADIVLDAGYRYEPIVIGKGRLLVAPIPEVTRFEGGRTWSYSVDGYVSDRLAAFHYVPPLPPAKP
jgi:hypothetical protein